MDRLSSSIDISFHDHLTKHFQLTLQNGEDNVAIIIIKSRMVGMVQIVTAIISILHE
jgi:hypothetical protein